jgi:ABC-type branched-subunit amino acid transport system ATPase component
MGAPPSCSAGWVKAYADLPAVELPYGRKRALEIATTLALDPEVLLLDEPPAANARQADAVAHWPPRHRVRRRGRTTCVRWPRWPGGQ